MAIRNGYHTADIRVRYAETDQMGIAYNAHYLAWFEVGRTEFMRELGFSYREAERDGFRLPLTEAGVHFLKPALYDDVLTIRTHILEKPGARLRIGYEVMRDTEVIATGFTEHVFTDTAMKPVRPSKEIRQLLTACWHAAREQQECSK